MGAVADDRVRLRTTFDAAADLYQRARPDYPEPLYDALVHGAGLRPGDELLEIGCATGKATLPLVRRGFHLTCLEIGSALAARARHNLADYRNVTIIEEPFETWQPDSDHHFELVFAATAWHWIDPTVRYQRAWRALRPGGHLAFWTADHVFPADGDPFFVDIQKVYDEIGEGLPSGATRPRPGQLPDQRAEIERSGLFTDVRVQHFDWEISYTAQQYLWLLDTFSGHIAMPIAKRDHLYSEITRRLAQRCDGRLHRGWGAVLHLARRT
jgi:SAM-dependent methyltransferase